MSESLTSESKSTFVCDCDKWMRDACYGEPSYQMNELGSGKLEGKRYCVLHFPSKEKSADFEKALLRKLEDKDFNFSGSWFPDPLSFFKFDFEGDAIFNSATFNAAADFRSATFRTRASFNSATFSSAVDFGNATFSAAAFFSAATFSSAALFRAATFNAVSYFRSTIFSALTDFRFTRFLAAAYFNATFDASADFSDSTFGAEAYFSSATFSAPVSFRKATLSAAYFGNATFNAAANFRKAIFGKEANFSQATFGAVVVFREAAFQAKADFMYSTFSKAADFRSATFSEAADFRSATFGGDAEFFNCTLKGETDFSDATFRDYVKFAGDESTTVFNSTSSLNLQFARIEKPDHLSFHTVSLRPHWFVNVDASKFDFTNVEWSWRSINGETKGLETKKVLSIHRLLAIACRQLAVNAEDNHRYEEASRFRYKAMDVRRSERWRGLAFWRLSWWYWLASGYGERVAQAFVVLLAIWFLFGLFYRHIPSDGWEQKSPGGDTIASSKPHSELVSAWTYSAGVMMLQKPEPRPATTAAQTVVLLETILGPVQAALLALAIRRKFMR